MLRLSRLSWLKYRTKGFPKLLKLVTAYLCKRDVRMIFYLDEFLFLSSSYREVWIRSARAVTLRQNVGFTVNREKSCLTPIQMLTFLGFSYSTLQRKHSVSQKGKFWTWTLCAIKLFFPQLRPLARQRGYWACYSLATWQAPLHFRYLAIQLIHAFLYNRAEIRGGNFPWPLRPGRTPMVDMVNGNLIRPPILTLFIRTDASKAGWGEVCQGQHTNERESDDKRTQHTDI